MSSSAPTIVPSARVRALNSNAPQADADYVLYWMCAQRRPTTNFALDHAIALANEQGIPVVVFEALRVGYEWASDRHHAFIIAGMRDHAAAFAASAVRYVSYVEPREGDGRGLLRALSARASHVVTDDYPCFFLPRMHAAAAMSLDVPLVAVDSCGLLPLSASERVFTTAASFRRHLQKTLPAHLQALPSAAAPKDRDVASGDALDFSAIAAKWPALDVPLETLDLAALPIDHTVGVVDGEVGGRVAALQTLTTFMRNGFSRYHDERNQPDTPAQSNLSAYLHYGHVGVHDVFSAVVKAEQWTFDKAASKATGSREGWWGMSPHAEAFLDEVVTWREVGHVFCAREPRYDALDTLPAWARETLNVHRSDDRATLYSDAELDEARTHDDVWNAAQRQLVREGRIHNYLRMLWGKKIYEWSKTPEDALRRLIHLNNRYALDGRDPNSYSGIFWTLGRFDRAWGPEREVYGKLRYMTSDSTRRKLKLTEYLKRYAA